MYNQEFLTYNYYLTQNQNAMTMNSIHGQKFVEQNSGAISRLLSKQNLSKAKDELELRINTVKCQIMAAAKFKNGAEDVRLTLKNMNIDAMIEYCNENKFSIMMPSDMLNYYWFVINLPSGVIYVESNKLQREVTFK